MNEGGHILNNVLSISTAANNRYLLHFNSLNSLTQWTAGIRLALFEHTTLQEAYTGSLIAGKGKLLNNIRTVMERTRFRYEDWARVRFGAGTPWRRCWFVVTPPDEKEVQKMHKQWKKKSTYDKMPVLRGDLKFYDSRKITKKSRPIATITDAWSAYAVYPQSKPLIDQSTLVKVEGRITIHSNPESSADGFVFVMPEVHPAITGFEMMLRFLFPVWDTFALYGRPNKLIAETLDSRGLMFAMPKDRRYGYLEILDTSGLIHTEGSQDWTDRRWRKEMKDLTSQRMAAATDGMSMSRRSSSQRHTMSGASLPPSRGNAIRFEEAGSGTTTPTKVQEYAGATPPRTSFGSLSHRRSASEALGSRSKHKQTPSPLGERNGGYESDSAAPRPPPHRTLLSTEVPQAGADNNHYETASEGRESPEADATPPPHTTVLPDLRNLHSPEPVEPPPTFAHAPSSRPLTKPNPAPELRRGHSDLDQATLSQMAEATRMRNMQGGALQSALGDFNFNDNGVQGASDFGIMGAERSQRGVNPGYSQRDQSGQGPLNATAYGSRLATIPASPHIPQEAPAPLSAAAFRSAPSNESPSEFPLHSQRPKVVTSNLQHHQDSPPSTASSGSHYTTQTPAETEAGLVHPGLDRSTGDFGVHRKPLPRASIDEGSVARPKSNSEEPYGAAGGTMLADVARAAHPPGQSPEKPRMGKKKTVGSVDLTEQPDIVVGEAHYSNMQTAKPADNDVPDINFGPTYRLDPTKRTGPPSDATSAAPSPDLSGPVSPQSDSAPVAPLDNRSTSSLGHRPGSSQSRLPLRPAYAHQHTSSVESASGKGPTTSGRSTPSSAARLSPAAPDREQLHVETMQRIEGLAGQIAGVELRPVEMDPIQYDGQALPRVVVFFLQQFRPRAPTIARDDPRERQERARILAISKQVHQRYEDELPQRRERAARQRAEMPPPGPGRPQSHHNLKQQQQQQQQQSYVDPRYVDHLQQQVRMNPRPQGVPSQPQQHGYTRTAANNLAHGMGPAAQQAPPHAHPQQSAYGEVNRNAGYTQEEAMRAGRFGPAPPGA